jgi:hypothetical protein
MVFPLEPPIFISENNNHHVVNHLDEALLDVSII